MKKNARTSIIFLISLVLILAVLLICPGGVGEVYGYYSIPYTFTSSMMGYPARGYLPYSYGYGFGAYNRLLNPFGFGGSYNLTSTLMGLYGTGLLGGLYGLGGISGLSGLYGLGGLCGLGGLYGMGSLYGLYGLNSLSGLGPGSLLSGLGSSPLSTLGLGTTVVAEQAGTWSGTWNLGFLFGTMILNLTENPLTGTLSGTAQLIGNLTFSGIFNVFGTGSTTFVQLNGQDPTVSYAIVITGTLTTPTTMDGFYTIYKVGATAPQETGTFSLELLVAAVI